MKSIFTQGIDQARLLYAETACRLLRHQNQTATAPTTSTSPITLTVPQELESSADPDELAHLLGGRRRPARGIARTKA
eukprot:m.205815 g.205815  ORF g.205815 m.205815 type:complete len:78 (-) comp53880_c0_seq1:1399-1632(-)